MSKSQAIQAFPLQWPLGWKRATYRGPSPYKVKTDAAIEDLLAQLRMMGARDIVISSNVPVRSDGTMYRGDHSDKRIPDPGVAVYWTMRNARGDLEPKALPCDHWHTPRENVRALGMAFEYMRGLKRCGAGEIQDRAFEGFKALPEVSSSRPWWIVLGVERNADARYVQGIYRSLAAEHHPDRGGDSARMAEINAAFAQFKAERG